MSVCATHGKPNFAWNHDVSQMEEATPRKFAGHSMLCPYKTIVSQRASESGARRRAESQRAGGTPALRVRQAFARFTLLPGAG